MSDTLTADMGYLYENVVARAIKASGRALPFVTKGCRENWYIEIETDIYDFVFIKRLAVTEGESTQDNTQVKVGCMAVKSNLWVKNVPLMYLRYILNDTLKWLKNSRVYGSMNEIFDVSFSLLQPIKEAQMGKFLN